MTSPKPAAPAKVEVAKVLRVLKRQLALAESAMGTHSGEIAFGWECRAAVVKNIIASVRQLAAKPRRTRKPSPSRDGRRGT